MTISKYGYSIQLFIVGMDQNSCPPIIGWYQNLHAVPWVLNVEPMNFAQLLFVTCREDSQLTQLAILKQLGQRCIPMPENPVFPGIPSHPWSISQHLQWHISSPQPLVQPQRPGDSRCPNSHGPSHSRRFAALPQCPTWGQPLDSQSLDPQS